MLGTPKAGLNPYMHGQSSTKRERGWRGEREERRKRGREQREEGREEGERRESVWVWV